MKLLLILLTSVFSSCSHAQTQKAIIEAFKKKDLSYIVNHASYPFDLMAGSEQDQNKIKTKAVLSKKLEKLFKENFFDEMISGRIIENSANKIVIQSIQKNENGELEAESSIALYFIKTTKGAFLINKIVVAG